MLDFDVVFVTYRSEKWIDRCVASIFRSDYDLKKLHLYFVDNASPDATVQTLQAAKEEYGAAFGGFDIIENGTNAGFGGGNNLGAGQGKAPHILFLNADTELYPDTLRNLSECISGDAGSDFALWELRQLPCEHPKTYDILTGETAWCSGAAFAVRREVYEKIGGFDESIFMYCEDVDLSWRVRAEGYRLRYVPRAALKHFSYGDNENFKPSQLVYSVVHNLLLRRKFGTVADRIEGEVWFLLSLLRKPRFKGEKTALLRARKKARPAMQKAGAWRKAHQEQLKGKPFRFYGYNYEIIRVGAFCRCERPSTEKKVSVIVRTCGRPQMLRETLLSLRTQTYPNVEVVIVEDGPNVSEKMIREEFSDLNVLYAATGEKRGRCYNGNTAMAMATGDYLNFLDDDDLFFADHVETLVNALEKNPGYKIAYSTAFETAVRVHSRDPYRYTVTDTVTRLAQDFDLQEILSRNVTPIQAVMFEKNVFEECGGLDESLDVLEDWDLWIRYALKHPFLYVPKTTSLYRVPADKSVSHARQAELDGALREVSSRYAHHLKEHRPDTAGKLAHRLKSRGGIAGLAYRCIRKAYYTAKKMKMLLIRRTGRTI